MAAISLGTPATTTVPSAWSTWAAHGTARAAGGKLMKRPPNGSWQAQEAQGQTNNEAMLFHNPTTDLAHVISYPGAAPHISSAPAFKAVPIPGAWQNQGSPFTRVSVSGRTARSRWSTTTTNCSTAPTARTASVTGRPPNGTAARWCGVLCRRSTSVCAARTTTSCPARSRQVGRVGRRFTVERQEGAHRSARAGPYIWDGLYEERALIGDAQSHRFAEVRCQARNPPRRSNRSWRFRIRWLTAAVAC